MKPETVGRLLPAFALMMLVFTTLSCTTIQPSRGDLTETAEQPGTGAIPSVLVATNRTPSEEPEDFFTGERSTELYFAEIGIGVKGSAKRGKAAQPSPKKAASKIQIVPEESRLLDDEAAFRAELRKRVQMNPSKTVAVFVHGYHSVFEEGVAFTTQLQYDSGYEGTSILFSWPSGGTWQDYVYDRDSIATSRDAFERIIRIAAESGAEQVGIVAHSMGCLLAMEALRQAAIAGDPTFGGIVSFAMLASPDISVDTFKSQLRRIGPDPRVAVLISRNDRYLNLSGFLAGRSERVGNFSDDEELAQLGVTVIDLTKVGSKARGAHYKFAEMPELMGKLCNQMNMDPSAAQGSGRAATSSLIVETGKFAGIVITTPFRILGDVFGMVQ